MWRCAALIAGGGRIFGRYLNLVPTQHRWELDVLPISIGYYGLESWGPLRTYYTSHSVQTKWCVFFCTFFSFWICPPASKFLISFITVYIKIYWLRVSAFKILTGKSTGKRPLGRPRRKWEDNIRMDLEEICINVGNWVDSDLDRNYWRALVNAALNLQIP